ncbi:LytR/AlgR family response regulator transcription factor [Myroides odoratimimus]|uniref:LytTR family transcriptional regulator n=1 Tax=Myroides odoratimimus TaxID=76832 RepID=A0AAI8C0Q1_9FLAO|nr:LytTR family DNA-binding domain-containing protein [Myroides odoratimimus]ALU24784.1 LytTR family transcriptional regulator [Myroides odoratimimus]MDM1034480.1 response regulator transcription factor [Myroides odoratimimus]MDM1036848.1 response regulator transcription factor [Myroides odoratimimus]MDM1051043.1 response regulator transcription factor [Myroides odoratimimus]MDM1461094.1 response regulator transcription factor [Myroides odoratimimus]
MMNELVVLVVDDEPKVAEVLKTIIEKKVVYHERIVVHTAHSVQEAVKEVNAILPDIVFLDIHMPEEDGFELFNYIDQSTFEVVFTTAYDQYAIEAINKYDCLKYLLKPIGIQDVQNVFDKYKELEGYHYFYKIIKNNQKRYIVRVEDIVYCKAADNYCEIYLKDQKYLVSKTLKNVEDKIKHKNFKRVNRSYLVNVDHIDYIDKDTNVICFKEQMVVNHEEVDNVITVASAMMKELNSLNI